MRPYFVKSLTMVACLLRTPHNFICECGALLHGLHLRGAASSGPPPCKPSAGEKDWALPGLHSRRVELRAYAVRISPTTSSRVGVRSPIPQTLKTRHFVPLDAVGENVVMALLTSGGGRSLEDASPPLLRPHYRVRARVTEYRYVPYERARLCICIYRVIPYHA